MPTYFRRRTLVRGCGLDQARSLGGDLYYPHDVRVVGDLSFGLDIEAERCGPVTLGWLSYNTAVEVTTGVLDTAYQVNIPVDGVIRTSSGPERLTASPSMAAVYRPDCTSSLQGWETPCRMLAIKIARMALENELSTLLEREVGGGPLKIEPELSLRTSRGAQWWAVVQALLFQMREDSPCAGHSALRAAMVRSMLVGLLLATDHPLRSELDAPAKPAVPGAIRRALDYIEHHAADHVTITDIAESAGVGVRALQQGFRTSLETTPLAHLREIRLGRAQHDLLCADPETTGSPRSRCGGGSRIWAGSPACTASGMESHPRAPCDGSTASPRFRNRRCVRSWPRPRLPRGS